VRKLCVLAMLAGLAGCAAPHQWNVTETQRLRCELEARRSTAAIVSGFQAGYERAQIMELCLRLAETENIDAAARAAWQQATAPSTAPAVTRPDAPNPAPRMQSTRPTSGGTPAARVQREPGGPWGTWQNGAFVPLNTSGQPARPESNGPWGHWVEGRFVPLSPQPVPFEQLRPGQVAAGGVIRNGMWYAWGSPELLRATRASPSR
jgi:hypothetical protein